AWSPGILAAFVAIVLDAAAEEILFRGFLFRTLRDLWGVGLAVTVSAIGFGAIHAFNPGATPVSAVAIALEAGVLLALAYAASESLWFPIGIHAGWNFAEGTIFGTFVSGNVLHTSLFRGVLHGDPILTGGLFGPEASIVAVVVCLAASALLIRRRKRLSAPA